MKTIAEVFNFLAFEHGFPYDLAAKTTAYIFRTAGEHPLPGQIDLLATAAAKAPGWAPYRGWSFRIGPAGTCVAVAVVGEVEPEPAPASVEPPPVARPAPMPAFVEVAEPAQARPATPLPSECYAIGVQEGLSSRTRYRASHYYRGPGKLYGLYGR